MRMLLISLLLVTFVALTITAKEKTPALKVGDKAPSFCAPDQTGKIVNFPADIKGKKALVFYPMASTPGCTKEMCSLRDDQAELKKNNITVVGISPSKSKNQKSFQDDHKLPFTLLTADKAILDNYGVNGFFFISRYTFLIDGNDHIVEIITHVDKKKATDQIIKGFTKK